MADWLGGSGEHQPGRAGARTAAQPRDNTQGRALHRAAETLCKYHGEPEWKLANTASGAMQGGVHTVHHTAPCVPC